MVPGTAPAEVFLHHAVHGGGITSLEAEGHRERDGEDDCGCLQSHTEVIGQIVRDQSPDDADEYHGKPVDPRDIFLALELEEKHNDEEGAHHE